MAQHIHLAPGQPFGHVAGPVGLPSAQPVDNFGADARRRNSGGSAVRLRRVVEDRLGGPQFQRVHRNAIVNVNHVRKLSALSSQRWSITLSNGLQLVVSKRQAHKIRQILQW